MPPETASSPSRRTVRIGCGAGFSGDRIEPAVDLAERGELDFLFFEGLAERTLALSHRARRDNPAAGYNRQLEKRFGAVLPGCLRNGTRIVSNMGAANPSGAAEALAAFARANGYRGLRIAVVEGDDVSAALDRDMVMEETGERLGDIAMPVVGANAYLGAEPLIEALETGAEIVLSGRVADPSLVVAPLAHAFGWSQDDWALMGAGTLVGHLLECGFQVTGGYFADPGYKDVPDIAYLGYPIAVVDKTGRATITKLDGTGGRICPLTVKEQLLYEVHDPAAYLTPDVTADFSAVTIAADGENRVVVAGASGRPRPERLKATIGFDAGFLAEAEIAYAGGGAVARAELARAILEERLVGLHGCRVPIRFDLIGLNALHGGDASQSGDCREVRLRVALRSADRDLCETLLTEMEAMWIAGPAGGAGMRGTITPSVTTRSLLVDRALAPTRVRVITA